MLDDAACSLRNGVPQLLPAVVAVDALAQFVAFGDICLVCLRTSYPGNLIPNGGPSIFDTASRLSKPRSV
jgi:hypothetical protein